MKQELQALLKSWCDALLRHQAQETGIPGLDGGIYCEACGGVHGRSPDAVYPLMYMADATGDKRYLDAAVRLVDWGEALFGDDGSYYNDHNSQWNGITVFFAAALHEAMEHHGQLLSEEVYERWEARLREMANWLRDTLRPGFSTNINYLASNAGVMAMLGGRFGDKALWDAAGRLGRSCLAWFGRDDLFIGEGKPMGHVTPRGCRAVDIGYNVEESLPMLAAYARLMMDDEVLEKVRGSVHAHLSFMLPDGGWDNTFGTRGFKWTYWGSRTSDGFQEICAWLDDDPLIVEAALRNARQYAKCTHDGLLYGGPHYAVHGEPPCIHHTICHAKALAAMLNSGALDLEDTALPAPVPPIRHWQEIDTYQINAGGLRATVTAYDFPYMEGGHPSGGTLSMLWHPKTGPIIAGAMTDYSLHEAHNMQLTRRKGIHRTLVPRVELRREGERYASCYDDSASIKADGEALILDARAALCDIRHQPDPMGAACRIVYTFHPDHVELTGSLTGEGVQTAVMVLPLIGLAQNGCAFEPGRLTYPLEGGQVRLTSTGLLQKPENIFFLAGGFEAWEAVIVPDEEGRFSAVIEIIS